MPLAAGVRVGSYEVLALIGSGGMGEVYRARDTKLNREVALKVLPDLFAHDPERLARFQREAQVVASLNHPNIAGIHGFEESGDVRALVLELVEGPTLADRIAQGPIPLDEALPIARQIAEALEAAHEHGVIHRDLKPANIKLTANGAVKVLDFGLAKLAQASDSGLQASGLSQSPTITSPAMATHAGIILGTAAYMSPEQAKGKAVDKRADIWGFGCVLFEMLSGQQPFAGETVTEALAEVMKSEPRWDALPLGLTPRLVTVLRRCLEKDPTRRVRDIGDVRLALDGAFDAPPDILQAHAAPLPPPAAPPLWRRAATYAVTLLAGAVVAGLAFWTLTRSDVPRVARFQVPLPADTTFSSTGRHIVALSPDGQLLVYVANSRLYLRRMDRLDATPVVGTEQGAGRSPFFSPDGQWIGFWAGGQLKRVGVNGGAPVVICEAANPWGVSWEEDGTILYGQGSEGIWRVPAAGGKPEVLIRVEAGEQAHGPQLLPDGEWVLFTFRPKGVSAWDGAQIVAQSLRTGERKGIIAGGRDARYLLTGHLVYGLNGVLLAAPFDVGTLQVRGGAVSLVEGVGDAGNTTGAVHFSIGSNGFLAYVPDVAGLGARRLVFVDRNGKEQPVSAEPHVYLTPRISPDGSRVAVHTSDSGNVDIWVWNVARENLSRFTFDDASDRYPLWSPDGSRIVFTSDREGGGLFWQRADGTGNVERLLESPRNPTAFTWAPDGSLIFDEEARAAPRDIRILKMNGERTAATLLGTEFSERRPALSPNGRWLAYESNESGQYEVYVRPFPEVDQGKWQVSRGGGEEPEWSPDGDTLYYLGPDGMMAVEIQGGPGFTYGSPSRLLSRSGYSFPRNARDFDVAPDGRFLLMKSATPEQGGESAGQAHLVLVEHWFEELRRLVPAGN